MAHRCICKRLLKTIPIYPDDLGCDLKSREGEKKKKALMNNKHPLIRRGCSARLHPRGPTFGICYLNFSFSATVSISQCWAKCNEHRFALKFAKENVWLEAVKSFMTRVRSRQVTQRRGVCINRTWPRRLRPLTTFWPRLLERFSF